MVLGKLKHVKARLSTRHDRCFSTKKRVFPPQKKALNLKRIDVISLCTETDTFDLFKNRMRTEQYYFIIKHIQFKNMF